MIVPIWNVTDAPGKTPLQIAIYSRTTAPGECINLPAEQVTDKVRALEQQGLIAIGHLPETYLLAKRKGRRLTPQELRTHVVKAQMPETNGPSVAAFLGREEAPSKKSKRG